MLFTPAHVEQAKGARARRLNAREMIRVRALYVEKRYKNCITACDELLQHRPATPLTPNFVSSAPTDELHPVHRAFLVFHQAISYECLGIAAHKYSQNKLRYLESAQQKYDDTLSILPQPFTTTEDGRPILADDSPTLRFGDDESHYEDDSGSAETAVPLKYEADSDYDSKTWLMKAADDPSRPEEAMSLAKNPGVRLRSISELEEYKADAEKSSPITWPDLDEARAETEGDSTASGMNQTQVDGPMEVYNITALERSRSSSSASIVTTSTRSTLSRALTAPNFDDYSPRQEPAAVHTPRRGLSKGRLPRSTATPLIDIGSIDGDSSEEENSDRDQQSGIPRSMRSLNLAAYDLSSEDSGSPAETPSKIPVARFNVHSNVPSTPRFLDNRNSEDFDETTPSPSKIPVASRKLAKNNASVVPRTQLTSAMESLNVLSTPGTAHTNRLSASLSSQHVLCEELVPSPLFRKNNKTDKKFAKITLNHELNPPRPLPRTPYSFHNHLSLLPARKTAVQTLISKFEGAIPSPGSSYITATPPLSAESQMTHYTPITPRFQLIHDTFAPMPTQSRLQAYLTSRSLAAYNAQLTAFRTCIRDASCQVEDMLQAAEMLQYQHEEEKRASVLRTDPQGLPSNRLASMWLLSTPGKPLAGAGRARLAVRTGQNGANSDRGASSARVLPRAEPHAHPARQKILMRHRVEESDEKRAERLRRLRDNGFRVRKEGKGWKGEEHYEELRRGVERELGR